MHRRNFITGTVAAGAVAAMGLPAVAKGPTPVGNVYLSLKKDQFKPVIGSVCTVTIADIDDIGVTGASQYDKYRAHVTECFDMAAGPHNCVFQIDWSNPSVSVDGVGHDSDGYDRITYSGRVVGFRPSKRTRFEYWQAMKDAGVITPNEIRGY